MARIESPCIGLCSTTLGDAICRGCKRDSDEILNWGGLSTEQRERSLIRIETTTRRWVSEYFVLLDKDQLEQQLINRRIRYTKRFHPLCWVMDLLRVGAGRIQQLSAYGLTLAPALASDSTPDLEQLYQEINRLILEETDRLICEKR